MNATLSWITAHMGSSWAIGPLDKYDLGRIVEWDAPANASADGPNITITVTVRGTGAAVEVDAWNVPLGHKTAQDMVTGVTGATAQVTNDNLSFIKPFSLTLTAAQAVRMAADINASRAYPDIVWSGLAGTPAVTVTFQTSAGKQSFLASRNGFSVHPLAGGPDLFMSAALHHELDVDIPAGQSSRPPSDQHPVLPSHVTMITAAISWPDSKPRKIPTTRTLSGAAVQTLVADLLPLSQDPQAGLCSHKGRPDVELRLLGDGQNKDFSYSGDCGAVSALQSLDGQEVVPFTASPALESDIARLLQ